MIFQLIILTLLASISLAVLKNNVLGLPFFPSAVICRQAIYSIFYNGHPSVANMYVCVCACWSVKFLATYFSNMVTTM